MLFVCLFLSVVLFVFVLFVCLVFCNFCLNLDCSWVLLWLKALIYEPFWLNGFEEDRPGEPDFKRIQCQQNGTVEIGMP